MVIDLSVHRRSRYETIIRITDVTQHRRLSETVAARGLQGAKMIAFTYFCGIIHCLGICADALTPQDAAFDLTN